MMKKNLPEILLLQIVLTNMTENLECDCSAAERDYEDSFIVCMKKFQCENEEEE